MRRRLDRDMRGSGLQWEIQEHPRNMPGRVRIYREEFRAWRNRQRRLAIREGLAEVAT